MQTKLIKTALLVSVGAGLLSSCDSNNQTPPSERYEYKHNGSVVLDKETKLEWMRCPLGEVWSESGSICEGKAASISFNYIDGVTPIINSNQSEINVSGNSDWRMPSIQELRSLRYCSELSAKEIDYLAVEENKQLTKALRRFADLQLSAIEDSNERIADEESEKETIKAKLNAEIADFESQIQAINAKLQSDKAALSSLTQQEMDKAAAKTTQLELDLKNLEIKFNSDIAALDQKITDNNAEKEDEYQKHKNVISSVESKYSNELSTVRALKKKLAKAESKKTSSSIQGLKEEQKYYLGLVEFFEDVYAMDRNEISAIASELAQLNDITATLDANTAQEEADIEGLEREIKNLSNPEIEDLFESELALSSLKRDYFLVERSIEADKGPLATAFEREYEIVEEALRVSKLDMSEQLEIAAQIARVEIQNELAIAKSTLDEVDADTARNIKIENFSIRKTNIVIDRFTDILEIESIDQLDSYLENNTATKMPNIERLENEILSDFKIFSSRAAELQGTFPGVNDRVREPCGYLKRTPVARYSNSDVKTGLTTGVWMLDEVAFPPTKTKRGNTVRDSNGVFFWSGDELGYNELFGWGVNFKDGISFSQSKGFAAPIRLVRDAD